MQLYPQFFLRPIHRGVANASAARSRPVLYVVYARPWYRDVSNFPTDAPLWDDDDDDGGGGGGGGDNVDDDDDDAEPETGAGEPCAGPGDGGPPSCDDQRRGRCHGLAAG